MKAEILKPLSCLLVIAAALALFEQDFLWTAQEHNLFLHTPLFFQQCMVAPGGLLTWAGAYLTQFFYYPALGAVMLCLLWASLMLLLKKSFRLSGLRVWLTLTPVVCLLLTVTSLGYWIFFIKLRGCLFDATLGSIVAVALASAYLHIPLRWWHGRPRPLLQSSLRSGLIVVTALVGYPLFGFYGLLAVLLMAVLAWRTDSHRLASSITALLAIFIVPLACYRLLYYETNIESIYRTALPAFSLSGESYPVYYLPYIALTVSLAALAVSYRKERKDTVPTKALRWAVGSVLAATTACVVLFWNKDGNFHRELAMQRQMERQDWEGMLATIASASGEPTRAMSMMKNLALQRTGRLRQDLNRYPDGFRKPAAQFPMHTVHTIGKMLYLQYGIPNYCYRWCMEDGVEYGWTAEELKLMVKCSLLNGEPVAAQRYLSLLKKTDFHRQWAQHYEAYVRQPSLIAQDKELKAIIPLLRSDDFLTSDQSQLELFLIEHLASANGGTPEQRELADVYLKFYLNRYRYKE